MTTEEAKCKRCLKPEDWHDEVDGACPDDDGPHPNSEAALEITADCPGCGGYRHAGDALCSNCALVDVEPITDSGVDPEAWRDEPEAEQDAPAFNWNNNRRVVETQILTRRDEFGSFAIGCPWEAGTVSDPDKFLDTFEGNSDWVIDRHDDRETPDTIKAVALRGRTTQIRIRIRSVYPGLYDNVERLKAWTRDNFGPTCQSGHVLVAVEEALGMILVHDQGERDAAAPEGHCRHGVYVGGCGIDWMCGACEDGAQ